MTLGVVGDLLEDVVVLLDEAPRRGGDAAARIVRRRGGSAANVASCVAELGAPVRLLTSLGDDPLGRRLSDGLRAEGVAVRASLGGRTGSVVVVVEPGGQRTMYPDRGAAVDLRLAPDDLAGLRLLHVTGYGLLPAPGTTGALGQLADDLVELQPPVSVDVSSVQVVEQLGDRLGELLGRLRPQVVFANEDEAEALGWVSGPTPEDLTVVVKRGARPAVVIAGGTDHRVPALPVDGVSDTTGAGDAFAAGYLVAVMAGHDPLAGARAGHEAAARHLTRLVR